MNKRSHRYRYNVFGQGFLYWKMECGCRGKGPRILESCGGGHLYGHPDSPKVFEDKTVKKIVDALNEKDPVQRWNRYLRSGGHDPKVLRKLGNALKNHHIKMRGFRKF